MTDGESHAMRHKRSQRDLKTKLCETEGDLRKKGEMGNPASQSRTVITNLWNVSRKFEIFVLKWAIVEDLNLKHRVSRTLRLYCTAMPTDSHRDM